MTDKGKEERTKELQRETLRINEEMKRMASEIKANARVTPKKETTKSKDTANERETTKEVKKTQKVTPYDSKKNPTESIEREISTLMSLQL